MGHHSTDLDDSISRLQVTHTEQPPAFPQADILAIELAVPFQRVVRPYLRTNFLIMISRLTRGVTREGPKGTVDSLSELQGKDVGFNADGERWLIGERPRLLTYEGLSICDGYLEETESSDPMELWGVPIREEDVRLTTWLDRNYCFPVVRF
jgi:hypothetical protein